MRKTLACCAVLMCLAAIRAFAANAYVQSKSKYASISATSDTLAFDSNVTAGSLIIVAVENSDNTITITSVTGNSNTFSEVCHVSNVGTGSLWAAVNANSGATTVTINYSASVARNSIAIHEVSGAETSSVAAAVRSSSCVHQAYPGSGTDAQTSGTLTSVAGDYIFGFISDDNPNNNGGQYMTGTSFTGRQSNLGTGYYSSEENIGSALTAATWTNSVSSGVNIAAASFKASGGGSAIVSPARRRRK